MKTEKNNRKSEIKNEPILKENYLDWNDMSEHDKSSVDNLKLEELELIFNSTQDALFLIEVKKEQFVYLRNNQRHQELTGLRLNEIYGRTPVDILGTEIGHRLEDYCRTCIETGEPLSFEETISFKGIQTVVLTKLTPLIRQEKARYIVGSRVDITQIRSLANEKEELLQKFKSMFDLHTAVMLLIEPYSGAIVEANPSASSFYGYTIDELKNMTIQEINVLSKAEVEELRLTALRKNQKYFLFPHRLKNGEIRYVDVYSCPIIYGDKKVLYSIIFDVTDREKNRGELFREKELLNITFDSIGDGVVTTDINGMVTRINRAAQDIIGWKKEEVEGKAFSDVFIMKNENTGEQSPDIISNVLRTGKLQELANHTVLYNKKGYWIPIEDSAAPILNEAMDLYGAVIIFRDVSLEKEKKERILYLSYHDELTGLYNRRYFNEELKKINLQSAYPITILMGDVNGLKLTNDAFGHEAGDHLLTQMADLIKENIKKDDMAIRWGGDEFVIIMPNSDHTSAERFIHAINEAAGRIRINDVIELSASFGYAIMKNNKKDMDIILQEAEEMMYRVKMLGRKSLRNSIVNTILVTLQANSSETEDHAKRLESNCLMIGRELGLQSDKLNELSLLSVLHDIGKIGVAQSILKKPGSLNAIEWMEMKKHSEIGYRIAMNIPEISSVADNILHHHERWDGTGYPHNLKETEIPLNCRILAVADAYDAMINDRSYRKAMSRAAAIDELKRNSGTQFDPSIIQIFIEKLDSVGNQKGDNPF